MARYYMTATKHGAFIIKPSQDGWYIWHATDCLDGPFDTAHAAAYELANGHCCWPSTGDPSLLAIPEHLSDWEAI